MNRPASPGPNPPQRRRSVPIANEDRLVVPDALGTTIKESNQSNKLGYPEDARSHGVGGLQPARQVLWPVYRADRRDVLRDPLSSGLLV
jgi:hypothetical protein